MKKKTTSAETKKEKDLPGYEPYPESEDIYSKFKEEPIDPEELTANAAIPGKVEPGNHKVDSIPQASELDIPGAELDDDTEAAGNEDEENNYYSLGGDNHEDLEEDKGN
jgi:hypothetical protein